MNAAPRTGELHEGKVRREKDEGFIVIEIQITYAARWAKQFKTHIHSPFGAQIPQLLVEQKDASHKFLCILIVTLYEKSTGKIFRFSARTRMERA
jgi:hypothetical protein